MARFILIHGMFHGGWYWAPIKARLEAMGHVVLTPDLAGAGDDRADPAAITLDRRVAEVAALVDAGDGPSILVGHSLGGLVASQTAECAFEKVSAIVYLAALMLPDATSVLDLPAILFEADAGDVALMPDFARTPDDLALIPPADPAATLYPDCDADSRAFLASGTLSLEPVIPLITSQSLTPARWGSLPRTYVAATRDAVLPVAAQRAMIRRSPPSGSVEIDAGHMLIVTEIDEVARILDAVASQDGNAE